MRLTLLSFLALSILLLSSLASADSTELVVAPDGRTFQYVDGTPFLWLGDTAWELFHKLDRQEATEYLEDRARKGFTVVQAVVLAELDGLRTPNAYGDLPLQALDPSKPNQSYFRHVDYIVQKAAELGLYIGMLPAWGDKVVSNNPGAGPVVFNPQNARGYGEFLGERYRRYPVIWILGGDRNVDNDEAYEVWEAMAEGLEAGHGGKQLMTFHPRGASSSSRWFHDSEWLDFNMIQSGHGRRLQPSYYAIEHDRNLLPVKPVVDGEPAYEDIAVAFWEYIDFSQPGPDRVPDGVLDEYGLIRDDSHFEQGFFSRDDIRTHMYWTFFSGAAGYTYGANAIWQMFDRGDPVALPSRETWREALALPGASDIAHVERLFSEFPLARLRPCQSAIAGANPDGARHARALLGVNRRVLLVYLPSGGEVGLKLDHLAPGEVRLGWFEPRSGRMLNSTSRPRTAVLDAQAPSSGTDWVAVITIDEQTTEN